MLRSLCATLSLKPTGHGRLLFMLHPRRDMHSRNKTAMELIAKGWSALKEVDRVIDYCELNDRRLLPLLRTAKENFELALEADNSNTHARYWLAKLHLKYHVPGKCLAVGAALLVEAANMGDPDAQYELGCRLRVEHDYFSSDQQAFYYLEKAVDQLHPGALYLLGAVYLTGDCVKQDLASAMWCFHRASEKGHAGAAIAYGSLLLRGPLISWILQFASGIAIQPLLRGETRVSSYLSNSEDIFQTVLGEQFQINSHVSPFDSHTMVIGELTDLSGSQKLFKSSSSIDVGKINEPGYIFGVHVPEVLTKFFSGRGSAARKSQKSVDSPVVDPVEMARKQFEIAAKAGCDLGFKWLNRLEEEEKRVLAS